MITAAKSRVFLALGGNLGNPLEAFKSAVEKLQRHPRISLQGTSSLYRTPAVGGPAGQPDYLNTVIELQTDLSPYELLDFCQQIENAAGRTREVRWGARTLDIDLLLYGQQRLNTVKLQLPHPRLQERNFVLVPLVELAADFIHPVQQQTVAELLARLPKVAGITRLTEEWINND